MRNSMLAPTVASFLVAVCCGVSDAGAEFPAPENAVKDDVDHWGIAFSDQLNAFESAFADFQRKAGKGKLDYVLGVETSLRKTFQNKYWFKGKVTDVVELCAGRNEAEAFQLAVLPKMGLELKDVTATVSDLKKTGGAPATIPASCVKLYRVGFVPTNQPAYPTRHVGLWPDPLMEPAPFSLKGIELGLFWCEVKVPADAAPGDYSGRLSISATNSHGLSMTIKLHVWDFVLPDRVQMPMLVWTGGVPRDEARRHYALLLEHHVDPISVGVNANLDEVSEDLKFCFERGLMYFQTIRCKNADSFRPYYENIKKKGWLDKALIYAAHDEPLQKQFEEIVVPATQRLHRDFPGLRVFLASQYHDGIERGTDILLMDRSTNFYSWLEAGRPGKQELWWYFCGIPIRAGFERPVVDSPRMLIDRDSVEHRVVYWMAFHYGVKGLFTYAGNRWPGGNDRWPEEAFKPVSKMHYPYAGLHNGDGYVIYPGPRPSIRLKNIRDGAEDYWYLARVAELARSGSHAAKAKVLLDGARPGVFVDAHYFNRNPQAMLDYRRKLGRFIEEATTAARR